MRRRTVRKQNKRKTRRKQSGGKPHIDVKKLKLVLNNRSRAYRLASVSAQKAEEVKRHFE